MSMAQVLKLKPAFTDDQADALAALFDEALATKADIERLRAELKADTERLDLGLRAEIEKLRLEVQRDLKSLENSILARMLTLFVGQGIAVVSLIVALQKILP